MGANGREVALSQVVCLLEEIETGKPTDSLSSEWGGYHPKVYNKALSAQQADALVATLCAKLSIANVNDYSLEMQMWWRDHQRWDAKRVEQERAASEAEAVRQKALEKLSPDERAALGLK
jgi:hypothetical protein